MQCLGFNLPISHFQTDPGLHLCSPHGRNQHEMAKEHFCLRAFESRPIQLRCLLVAQCVLHQQSVPHERYGKNEVKTLFSRNS